MLRARTGTPSSGRAAMIEVDRGLAVVVVGETAVSLVDGANGALYYRGAMSMNWWTGRLPRWPLGC